MKTLIACVVLAAFAFTSSVLAWTPKPVALDPLVRMPGTQPSQGVNLENPNRCLNCHSGYNPAGEPGFQWMGSMMAQAARDPMLYACLTVANQDSIWALGNPNAGDICERCHFPEGWLGGRSDPTNASAMTGSDFDGLHCDVCHRMWDPFFADTYAGTRESNDWINYWDEAGNTGPGSGTLSQTEADKTLAEDASLSAAISLFSGTPLFGADNNRPVKPNYTENASGQYFMSPNAQKRASFADADARHQMLYSRYHKSKYFCGTCHDVSNPALANLGMSGLTDDDSGDLITEQYSASRYFHVERTFSEFLLSAYGQPGGASTNQEFRDQGAPDISHASKCQDCHMRDIEGTAANKTGAVFRPSGSTEHPESGLPLHDLTGGNAWISYILASLDPDGPVPDPVNLALLDQGPSVLTLDLSAGQTPKVNGAALKAGSDRAKQQLLLAATLMNLSYDDTTGVLNFRIQNNAGHKLISGFPEGRRMFVNIQAYDDKNDLIYEVNPYDYTVGTLKGMPDAASLGTNEAYVDTLVYEVHPSSSLTGEQQTFHFVLADGRSKDNRIPPKGFDIANATARHSEPVGATFTTSEYAGGYDDQRVTIPATIAPNVTVVKVSLYYQGTSREYIAFLRDEIKGSGGTLASPTPSGEAQAYIAQTDPFFTQLKAWGATIWDLWYHNHGLDGSGAQVAGIVPFLMAEATLGTPPAPACDTPAVPSGLMATGAKRRVELTWNAVSPAPSGGYLVSYDLAGKQQFIASTGDPSYIDTGLTPNDQYCYVVQAWNDCDPNDGGYNDQVDHASGVSTVACGVPTRN
jgi:hypothetical protein